MEFIIRSLHRLSARTRRAGFTLVELLTVMAIIAILAGLILSIAGYAQKKAALARAAGEVKALCSACESYKADNGTYPRQALAGVSGTIPSDGLDPKTNGNSIPNTGSPTLYMQASLELYQALTSDTNSNGFAGAPAPAGTRNYLGEGIKPDMLGRSTMTSPVSTSNPVMYLSDAFGNSYGYSTAGASVLASGSSQSATSPGFNATFDLWCTAGLNTNPALGSGTDPQLQWIKNW